MLGELLQETPIISAVKSMEGLERCLSAEGKIVFVLFGDVMNIGNIVKVIQESGRMAFVHIDLVEGLASRDVAVDFLARSTKAEGILSTKPALIRRAKAQGLLAIQRYFVLDSIALQNVEKQFPPEGADAVEILPGIMPKVIRRIASVSTIPLIAGGLISDKEDVMTALGAGAMAVSTTNSDVWFL